MGWVSASVLAYSGIKIPFQILADLNIIGFNLLTLKDLKLRCIISHAIRKISMEINKILLNS